jgi:hypothetical protein
MPSLYDELNEKLKQDPRLTKRGGARYDLGMMLFDEREALHELWLAAERSGRGGGADTLADLRAAVETLRPLFGERG